jgi:rhamnogalacturonan endolyase
MKNQRKYRPLLSYVFVMVVTFAVSVTAAFSARQMERLDRGLVAVKSGSDVFLSWRLFITDPTNVSFNVYRGSEATPLNSTPLSAAHTSYTVTNDASANATYSVEVLVGGAKVYRSKPVGVWGSQYLNIPVEKPTGYLASNKTSYTAYSIYDGAVGDLDGDGQYEIVFFWAPDNMKDNSQGGVTANVLIDAYKLDGAKLWGAGKYIDLGSNIRAGAHYQHFLVFDFDGDGKAEIITKTAPGTTDTKGTMIDGSNAYLGNASGYVLAGPEYVSVFEGATGKLLDTKPYDPPRHPDTNSPTGSQLNSVWGDNYGNRCDRFLAAVAFLDGARPSAVMCRGYYTRTALCAWDWNGVSLTKRWLFDTRALGSAGNQYTGQGNHSLSVADVDNDGKDEIIYGSLTVDDNGTALYTTGLGHGDAMHVGKLNPSYPDLLVMGVHEEYSPSHTGPVTEVHNARTGEIVWQLIGDFDNGRGISADIDPEYPGEEVWSSATAEASTGIFSITGTRLTTSRITNYNMAIYWDGDVGRELFDGGSNPSVTKVAASESVSPSNLRNYSTAGIFTFTGASTNGGSKNNPCLQADILGDWREEVILRASDNTALRVYTTVTPTVHTGAGAVPSAGIYTLMHNKEYRLAVAWQNVGYNQPPHVDYFLGYNTTNKHVVDESVEKGSEMMVSFNPNGGKFTADSTTATKTITTITGTYFELPEVERKEYDFAGWLFGDGKPYNPTQAYREDLQLSAKWTRFYTLTFDPNGGTPLQGAGSKIVSYNDPVGALPVPAWPTADSAFDGWNTERDGSGATYTEATAYTESRDLTLYAQWRLFNVYTLTFDPNGGTLSGGSSKHVTLHEAVGELPAPLREGYTLAGWNERQDGSGVAYTAATVYRAERHSTLYAQWSENFSVTLSFNPNGGELPGAAAKTVVYGVKVGELPVPTRSGYAFAGWNTKLNGSGATYTDSTVCTYDGATLKLYAQWSGSGSEDPTAVEVELRQTLKLYPNPVSNGRLTIENGELGRGEKVEIFSLSGELVGVYELSGGKVTTIDIAHLPSGAYIVKVHNKAEKILKN